VLGIIPAGEAVSSGDSAREAGLIQLLIEMRKAARQAKNFKESDRIRDELAKLGVVLEDRADGTIWRAT
jgi:cysteinyl-tRNA synthetase